MCVGREEHEEAWDRQAGEGCKGTQDGTAAASKEKPPPHTFWPPALLIPRRVTSAHTDRHRDSLVLTLERLAVLIRQLVDPFHALHVRSIESGAKDHADHTVGVRVGAFQQRARRVVQDRDHVNVKVLCLRRVLSAQKCIVLIRAGLSKKKRVVRDSGGKCTQSSSCKMKESMTLAIDSSALLSN